MVESVDTGMVNGSDYLVRDDPAGRIFRVNRRAMTSPEIFADEQRRIFDRCWLYLGHESEIPQPGDFRTRTLVGRPLIFCRGDDGAVRALINSCPHRGAMVCRAQQGNAKAFHCLYHSWSFKNTGVILDLPGADAYSGAFDDRAFSLALAPRQTSYRGFFFISFDREAQPLENYLAGAREYLDAVADQGEHGMEVIAGTQLYCARANWKLLVENSIDFYHTVPLHKTYFKFLKDFGTDLSSGVSGRGHDLGNGHAVVKFRAGWGRPVARWEPSWGEAERERLAGVRADLVRRVGAERAQLIADTDRNLCVFPNLLINDIMATVLRQANPISADYMEITQWALAPVGEPVAARARRLQSFNTFLGPGGFATPDDIEALEGCQRGFAAHREMPWSDYSRGYAQELEGPEAAMKSDFELQIRAFYRRWAGLMDAPVAGAERVLDQVVALRRADHG
jgi:phenylpropionate dioxygenase-like ring-hydroxylating dioxygenase large terminal subunit